MESTTIKKSGSEIIYCPSSFTERAFSSNISISSNGHWMAHCLGNVIALRSLVDFKTTKIYQGHKVKTSSAGFSPNGAFVASGDIEGNIKIWFIDDLSLKKEFNKALGGKINGIEWNGESDKLFFYGEGKNAMARCITWDSGNNLGEIASHSKTILAGDLRKIRPYRVATGSEDFQSNFYEGTPFKFKSMNKEHNNFVTGVRFSPDSSQYVTVAFDKKIVLYDGKDGNVLYTLAEDKSTGNHTMAIMGVCWINDTTIATCSLDKSVKVWDLTEKVCKFTLHPKGKASIGIPQSGCGINSNGTYLFSLALSGEISVWEISTLEDGALPYKIIDGHQNYISSIVHSKVNNLTFSADTNGKILVWNGNDNEFLKTLHVFESKVISMILSKDETTLNVLNYDGNVSSFNIESGEKKY
jgi:WD40 repeat protein